jgi:type 1 glutamine amidotransferase
MKLLAVLLSCAALRAAEPAIQALILSGYDHHDWRSTTPYLRKLLTDTGRFEVRVEEEPVGITAGTLEKFDVLILHYNGARWPQATEDAVLRAIHAGKGAVAVHAATYTFSGLKTQGPEYHDREFIQPRWTAWGKMVGAYWSSERPPSGHAGRKVFTAKFTEPRHPITQDLPPSFRISDELYRNLRTEPDLEVLATGFDGKDQPLLWVHKYGAGRVCYTAWGHDLSSMQEPEFGQTFARAAEWVAKGKVEPPVKPGDPGPRVLVVTGGHDYETSFYTLFENFRWKHAVSAREAFKADIRGKYDVLVLYNLAREASDAEKKNLQDFAESGKGVVVLHHALCSHNDWPWYAEMAGGKYGKTSTFKHDQDLVVKPVNRMHPLLTGVGLTGLAMWEMHITDETYKGMWISPQATVLLRTDDQTSDGPVAWISPYSKSRVVTIQLGHDHTAHNHPAFRDLVKNAILWADKKL